MSKYVSENAIDELVEIGSKILYKAELDLQKKKVHDVARLYALVRRESEKIEDEARMLRLEGKLDETVYKQLSKGYDLLGKDILEIAKSYWLIGDVMVLSRSLIKTIDRHWGSVAEYARKEITS